MTLSSVSLLIEFDSRSDTPSPAERYDPLLESVRGVSKAEHAIPFGSIHVMRRGNSQEQKQKHE